MIIKEIITQVLSHQITEGIKLSRQNVHIITEVNGFEYRRP